MAPKQGTAVQLGPSTRLGRPRAAFRRALGAPETSLAAALVLLFAAIWWFDARGAFFSGYSLRTTAHSAAMYGVLAVGAAVVIIAGGIDLSIGSVAALASVVATKLMADWLPALAGFSTGPGTVTPAWAVVVAIALTLSLGVLVGFLHVGLIAGLKLPPFLATLATMAALRSLAILIARNRPVPVRSEVFRGLGRDLPVTLAIFAGVAVVVAVVLGRTVLGRHLHALGGNETAARLCGLRTTRLKLFAYGLAAMLSALGGLLFTAKDGQGQASLGVSYELYAIAAAVVGGCSLAGGSGTILGTVLGLVLIRAVIKATGLLDWGVDSSYVEGLVLGAVVVVAVALNQRARGRS
jgi:ribose/xylose/arabinose/galactoside ABC-type transport system permease subunit